MYEVCPDAPYFLEMSNYMSPAAHQAIGFQQKNCCNVKDVEFAHGFQLTLKEVESLSFTIPRVKVNSFTHLIMNKYNFFPCRKISSKTMSILTVWHVGNQR